MNKIKALEARTDFEKRYGTINSYGRALEAEQKFRDKIRVKKILKQKYGMRV